MVSASTRFEKLEFAPNKLAPLIGVGVDREFMNDYAVRKDPTWFHGKVGASMNFANGGRLEASYSINKGMNGHRRHDGLTMVYSLFF